jgi:transaldolase
VLQCALEGIPIVTAPLKVYQQMIRHPLTDAGIERFLADWEKARQNL